MKKDLAALKTAQTRSNISFLLVQIANATRMVDKVGKENEKLDRANAALKLDCGQLRRKSEVTLKRLEITADELRGTKETVKSMEEMIKSMKEMLKSMEEKNKSMEEKNNCMEEIIQSMDARLSTSERNTATR